jgi:flagellin
MRIGSSLLGVDLAAQNNLYRVMAMMSLSSTRLATMHRINAGADDPAGLIASENLRAELAAINAASSNTARAGGMIQTADSAMAEVSELLNSIRGDVIEAAGGGLTDAGAAAKQLEVDAALDAIDLIGSSTQFVGRKLLQGGTLTFVFSPDVGQTAEWELPDVSTSSLGGEAGSLSDLASGGSASLVGGDPDKAMEILDAAGAQVLAARAEAGAFERYTVDSSQQVLNAMEENISAAFSQIYDTDVAVETSRLIQSQILVRAAISVLRLAGQQRGLWMGM